MDIGAVDAAHSLFQLQDIPFENRFVDRVSTFFDSGSNVNLVTEGFARRAKLKGQPMLQSWSWTGAGAGHRIWRSVHVRIPVRIPQTK